MRDIREDLRQRLEAIDERRLALVSQIKALEEEATLLKKMMMIENNRAHSSEQRSLFKSPPMKSLSDYVIDRLRISPCSREDLRARLEMAGYLAMNEAPGRTFHMTLVNLLQNGRIEEHPDGILSLSDKEKALRTLVPRAPPKVSS